MLGGYRPITSITKFKFCGGYRPCTTYIFQKCWEVMMFFMSKSLILHLIHLVYTYCWTRLTLNSSNKALLIYSPLFINFLRILSGFGRYFGLGKVIGFKMDLIWFYLNFSRWIGFRFNLKSIYKIDSTTINSSHLTILEMKNAHVQPTPPSV